MYKGLKTHYKETNELKGNERMSGIKRTDRLMPVITVVIYFGSNPWDGPMCLHDMLDVPDELKPFVNNPKLNLVEMRNNKMTFHNQNNTDLFSLMGIILDDSLDRQTRREKLEQYESGRSVDSLVHRAIAASTNVDLSRFEEEEEINVCKIWDEVREDGKAEGKIEGRAEGKAEGEVNGRAQEIISMGQEFGLDKNDIINRIQTKLKIDSQAAEKYYQQFAGEPAKV